MRRITFSFKLEKKFFRWLYFIFFAFFLSLFPSPNVYFETKTKGSSLFFHEKIDLPPPPLYPINLTSNPPPSVSAEGIYIVDLSSNVVLYQLNQDKKFLPASTTKIATALVVLDYYKPEEILKVKNVISEGRRMGLVEGEEITVESLLYGLLIHSANDAAFVFAENYPGGIPAFVEAMNQKVKNLNLQNTHFTNPAGFDDEKNYTTPADLAKLAKAALENKMITKIIGTKNITVADINFTHFHPLFNVNELLGKIKGVAGVKTGFTDNAGEILVTRVKREGKDILFVVLKSKDRFHETEKLIDWVFANFAWRKIQEIIPDNSDQWQVDRQ